MSATASDTAGGGGGGGKNAVPVRDEADEVASVVTMILTTSPIPTCPAIDMISITLDSIYRNPQLRKVKLLLVCDGSKVVAKKNAYRSGRVTAEAQQKYTEYKANLQAQIEAKNYPYVTAVPHYLAFLTVLHR